MRGMLRRELMEVEEVCTDSVEDVEGGGFRGSGSGDLLKREDEEEIQVCYRGNCFQVEIRR